MQLSEEYWIALAVLIAVYEYEQSFSETSKIKSVHCYMTALLYMICFEQNTISVVCRTIVPMVLHNVILFWAAG